MKRVAKNFHLFPTKNQNWKSIYTRTTKLAGSRKKTK